MKRLALSLLLALAVPASAATIITRGTLSAINLGFGSMGPAGGGCPTSRYIITAGTGVIVAPTGCGHVLLEAWSAGATGNGGLTGNGHGGAGGGYEIHLTPFAVSVGAPIYYQVGSANVSSTGNSSFSCPNADSWFNLIANNFPGSASQGVYATGACVNIRGSYAYSTGYSGGLGAGFSGTNGGGGGGGAGSTGNGVNASNATGGAGGTPDGGAGGNGANLVGNDGTAPGGGGGGSFTTTAGTGAGGQLAYTWSP